MNTYQSWRKAVEMGIPLKDVMKKISPKRQKNIKAQADEYIKEYQTLQELRKGLKLTQTDLAENLSVKQVSVSNLENRPDMLLSTLNNYVEAMGCELEIFIKTPDQTHVKIKNLLP
jgi:DNA-binding XRE family transcriptional regulator